MKSFQSGHITRVNEGIGMMAHHGKVYLIPRIPDGIRAVAQVFGNENCLADVEIRAFGPPRH